MSFNYPKDLALHTIDETPTLLPVRYDGLVNSYNASSTAFSMTC